MHKSLRKLVFCPVVFILAAALWISAPAAWGAVGDRSRIDLDEAVRKRMSAFISCFTEVEMFEIRNFIDLEYSDFIYFGVMHNYYNSPELVKVIAGGKAAAQYLPVFTTVKKYFGLDADTADARSSAT